MESESALKLSWVKERVIYLLVALFPIAGVTVQHWYSMIFSWLVYISLWDLVKYRGKRPPLFKEEKIWLWLCAGFFATYMISGLVNGWSQLQTRFLGVDIRFLAVVPLYLMLRLYPLAWRYLLAGILLAAPVLAAQAYYDTEILRMFRAQGFYSPNLMGPVAALVAMWALSSWSLWGARLRWLIPVVVVVALYAVAVSGSRGAYLGLIAMALVWALLSFKGWWRALVLAVVIAVPVTVYHSSAKVEQRVDVAMSEVATYFKKMEEGKHYSGGTVVRFEMWRAGWLVFKDAPILGVGRGNYQEVVKQYVGQEGLPPSIAQHGHAHNVYVDVLIARGLIGFVIFMGMLCYPLYYFIRTRHASPQTALFGILQIVGYIVFSLTDASPFIMGNFVAIFLLGLSIFFSRHLATVKRGAD